MKFRFSASVLLSGVLWGIIGLFVRSLDGMGLDSMQIIFLRALFSAIMLLAVLLVTKRELLKIRLRDLWCFIGTGLLSLSFFNFCYFHTMTVNSLATASVLLYTAPVFVTVLSVILFRERLTPLRIGCLVLALAGCVLVTGVLFDGMPLSRGGILTGLGAGLGYALYSIFGRYALERGYHTLTVNVWTFLVSTVSLIPLAKPTELGAMVVRGDFPWLDTVLLALVCTVLPYLLYTYGLTKTDNSTASVLATVEPVVATLMGLAVFGEKPTLTGALGIVLVLFAVVLLNLPHRAGERKTRGADKQ